MTPPVRESCLKWNWAAVPGLKRLIRMVPNSPVDHAPPISSMDFFTGLPPTVMFRFAPVVAVPPRPADLLHGLLHRLASDGDVPIVLLAAFVHHFRRDYVHGLPVRRRHLALEARNHLQIG